MVSEKLIFTMMRLIRFAITNEDSSLLSLDLTDNELKQMLYISRAHDVAHLICYAFQEKNFTLKGDVATEFYNAFIQSVSRYEQQNYEFENICKVFEREKIKYIPLKGATLWKIYPKPWMRTCVDVDILIEENDLKRAINALIKNLKFAVNGRGPHDVGLISSSGWHVDLHFNLVEDYYLGEASKPLLNIWDYAVGAPDSFHYSLPDEVFYYYHVAHMAKHFINGGCGIRPFIDLWILNHFIKFDKNKRDEFIKNNGLKEFESSVRKLSEAWFSEGQLDELTKTMQTFIVEGGKDGNVENRVAATGQANSGKFRYIWSRVFLPYSILKNQYPVLKKHKFLLPIMELRRCFSLIFRGRVKNAISEIKTNKSISEKKQSEITAMMEKLELKVHK